MSNVKVTIRLEDEAYCLMGIFEVDMPLLYAEGEKSFVILQEEIHETLRRPFSVRVDREVETSPDC